jgi:hypothetical protein
VEASLCLCPCPVEAEFVQAEEAERFAAPAEVPHCAREAAGDSAVQVVPSAAGPNSFLVAADGPLGVPEAARCAVPAGDSAAKVAPLAAERSSVPVAEGALPDVPAVLHSAPEAQAAIAEMLAASEAAQRFSLHPEDGAPVAHSCCFPDCSTADHSVDDRLPALSLRWAHSFHFRAVRYLEDAAPVDPERCSLTVGFRDC